MQSKQHAYLAEMEIEPWQLCHPERMQGITIEVEDIDSEVRLLLVSASPLPTEQLAFLEKVLSSFDIKLNETLVTQPGNLIRLGEHMLEWAWFIDCPVQPMGSVKQLSSSTLEQVSTDPRMKKALWNQILSLKES